MAAVSKIDSGGSLAVTGKSIGEDLLSSAKLDLYPMPETCKAFGILDAPYLLTALRLHADEVGVTAEQLDELAKLPSPSAALAALLGLAPE